MNKDGWTTVTLGDIAENISVRVDDPSKSGLDRFVGLVHLDSGSVTVSKWDSTESVTSSMKQFQAGDVLLARRNAHLRRASAVDFEGVCSGDAYVLREKSDAILPGLLKYILNTDRFWEYAIANADGSMSTRAKWNHLERYVIRLPSLSFQETYMTKLTHIFTCIRNSKYAITLIPTIRQKYLSEVIGSNYCDIDGSLGEYCDITMGQSPSGSAINSNQVGLPFIQGGGEFGTFTPRTEKFSSEGNKTSKPGSILMTVRAPVGDLNISDTKYIIGRGLCSVSSTTFGKLTLRELLRSNRIHWRKRQQGSTFKAVSKGDVADYPIRFPKSEIEKTEEVLQRLELLHQNYIQYYSESVRLAKNIINSWRV